jgi:hypothetical protein
MKRFLITDNPKGNCRLVLTDGQDTSLGKMCGQLYYTTQGEEFLSLAPSSVGYPHNGGQHTLTILGPISDVCAWFELLVERYKKVSVLQPVFKEIKLEINDVLKDLK